MAKKTETSHGLSKPVAAMIIMAILGALVSGGSFELIKHWPLPQSVEPYFGWEIGWVWGLCAGGVFGFILGFITDDRHFTKE